MIFVCVREGDGGQITNTDFRRKQLVVLNTVSITYLLLRPFPDIPPSRVAQFAGINWLTTWTRLSGTYWQSLRAVLAGKILTFRAHLLSVILTISCCHFGLGFHLGYQPNQLIRTEQLKDRNWLVPRLKLTVVQTPLPRYLRPVPTPGNCS